MDIKREIRRFVPAGALGVLGLDEARPEPIGEADLTILFTDVDDYTALTDRLGDKAAHELIRVHDRLVREALTAWGGREVKHTGDGIMACFPSAARALGAAAAVERSTHERNLSPEAGEPLRIAIGLNTGAPIAERGDLFGTAVIVAARITDEAEGGQILASDVVRQLAAGKGFVFRPVAPRRLEGLADEVPLFEVVWQEDGMDGAEAAA